MRDQLKELTEKDYWVYDITESDFDHAVNLIGEMIDARTEQYEKEAEKVRAESHDVAYDILDDRLLQIHRQPIPLAVLPIKMLSAAEYCDTPPTERGEKQGIQNIPKGGI